jgi:hypothetical protein
VLYFIKLIVVICEPKLGDFFIADKSNTNTASTRNWSLHSKQKIFSFYKHVILVISVINDLIFFANFSNMHQK